MSKKCPYCVEEIEDAATVCPHCKSSVSKQCPYCAETINVMANVCRFCGADLASPAGAAKPGGPARPGPAAPQALSNRPIGEVRNPILVLVLGFFTCGIYMLVLQYKWGCEINEHNGNQELSPGLDVLLAIVTCGLWWMYVMYKYSKAMYDMSVKEGIQAQDQSTMVLILALLGLVGIPSGLVIPLIMQTELNKHWEAHGAPKA